MKYDLDGKDKTTTAVPADLVQLPFTVTERFKTVVFVIIWLLGWTILLLDITRNDDLLNSLSSKWDPIDIMFAVGLLVVAGFVPPVAVWFTSTTLWVNHDSIQISRIFGLGRRQYTIGDITDVQIFGKSNAARATAKVQQAISINFSDGRTETLTATATNFDRLLSYLELKASARILK